MRGLSSIFLAVPQISAHLRASILRSVRLVAVAALVCAPFAPVEATGGIQPVTLVEAVSQPWRRISG